MAPSVTLYTLHFTLADMVDMVNDMVDDMVDMVDNKVDSPCI